jgi:hypothetical protein
MDECLQFCLERNPQILVYKAIFEMVEELEFPIESREDLRKQFVNPDSKAEERVEIIALMETFFPAYLFPMPSNQNALEKITEMIESILNMTPMVGIYSQPRREEAQVRITPSPLHPERCEGDCKRLHIIRMQTINEAMLHGSKLYTAVIKEINNLNKCLDNCRKLIPILIPLEK